MKNQHHAFARDELIRIFAAYSGFTTDAGDLDGSTLVDANLIGKNDFISGKTILLQSGLAIFEDRGATAFNPVNGQITVNPAFSSQVLAGTGFYVLNASSLAAAMALMNQGLVYYGVVTDVPFANTFTIAALVGLGANKFIDLSAVTPYSAFVFRDAAGGGAPPQGEYQPITAYDTGGGTFTTPAFTVPVGIGDEILIIHPFLAKTMNFTGLPPHVGSTPGAWQTAEADIVSLGAANVRYKLHSLLLDINALVGTVTIRMYQEVVGVERRVYQQAFTVAVDGPGLWIVNGTVGIHEILRVTAQSDNAADNAQPIGYDYMLEAM